MSRYIEGLAQRFREGLPDFTLGHYLVFTDTGIQATEAGQVVNLVETPFPLPCGTSKEFPFILLALADTLAFPLPYAYAEHIEEAQVFDYSGMAAAVQKQIRK